MDGPLVGLTIIVKSMGFQSPTHAKTKPDI